MNNIAIIGSGFSGATIANQLAEGSFNIDVFESRGHIGGNCFTERDPDTGIMLHRYGPHIFHTDNEEVWSFVRRFDEFLPFTNRVKAIVNGGVFSLPINLLTINNFFGKNFSPIQAKAFIESKADKSIATPANFEEQALSMIGKELYEGFFKGYTIKQWGIDPKNLPAYILKRLPIRFTYDDNYYNSKYQGMPLNGYTHVIKNLLNHKNIKLHLETKFTRDQAKEYSHVFYSGPIDSWFNYEFGRLKYRTLDFTEERLEGDFQGNAVINYCDLNIPYTRISEHKFFSPWETHKKSVIYKEYSRDCMPEDIPYYPLNLTADSAILGQYKALSALEANVTFVGRLGTYQYLDMDKTIEEALKISRLFLLSNPNASHAQ